MIPSRRVRCELGLSRRSPLEVTGRPFYPIIPFPTGRAFFFTIPGTSYLATFIQSLRDTRKPIPVYEIDSTPLGPIEDEDDDEDDYDYMSSTTKDSMVPNKGPSRLGRREWQTR